LHKKEFAATAKLRFSSMKLPLQLEKIYFYNEKLSFASLLAMGKTELGSLIMSLMT